MKKILLGILIGISLTIPMGALAYTQTNTQLFANKFIGFDSEGDTVSVFDDGDNKCYIASGEHGYYNQGSTAISCVKR